jgi:heme/copper-type cytochrome/quinol oxidase subunit 4
LTVFAALVSVAFALLMREGTNSQVKFGLVVFFCFIASAFVLGWFMYPFPS